MNDKLYKQLSESAYEVIRISRNPLDDAKKIYRDHMGRPYAEKLLGDLKLALLYRRAKERPELLEKLI